MRKLRSFAALALMALAQTAFAGDPAAGRTNKTYRKIEQRTGTIEVRDGLGALKVPRGFFYVDKADANYVLETIWGNPHDEAVLGMLVPDSSQPNADYSFVMSYTEDGYVEDGDADDIDYKDLLEDMQESTKSESEARVKEGYASVSLLGWAAAPKYDPKNHILHWAKRLKFGDAPGETLNYDLRLLGRKGFLVISAIAQTEDLAAVEKALPNVMHSFTFAKGERYDDFKPDLDKVAKYSLAALIGGKLLAKTGLLAGIGIFLLKFIKIFIVAAAAGASALWKKLRGKKPAVQPEPEPALVEAGEPDEESSEEAV